MLNFEACRAIQHAFSKPSLANLISEDLSDSTSILRALPGKVDIKRREPGSLQVGSLFKLAITTCTVVIDFRVESTSLTTSFKIVQRHDDLIKACAVRYATFIRSTCNNAVNMRGN